MVKKPRHTLIPILESIPLVLQVAQAMVATGITTRADVAEDPAEVGSITRQVQAKYFSTNSAITAVIANFWNKPQNEIR